MISHNYMATLGWTEFPDEILARAEEVARKALSLDPESAAAYQILSSLHTIRLQYELALVETDRALALNPSDSESHAARGNALLWMGRIDEASAQLEIAFDLNPNLSAADAFALGLAYYLSRRLDDAARFLEPEVLRNPDYIYNSVLLAAAYGQLGRAADAQRMAEEVRRQLPGFDARAFGSRLQNPAQAAEATAPEIGRLSSAAAKKVEPQSSAEFGFLSLTLAFYILGSMRELTKAKPALSM